MSQKRLKVVISGGGTGGHIYPALAIARGLAEQEGAEILYLGGRQSLESRLAQEAGFAFREIRSSGLQGNAFRKMKALYANYQGMKEAKRLLAEYRPQLAIGTGGYVGAPVLFAAAKLGIPTMIHEQNAFPGKANRLLGRYVDRICLTFEEARSYFPQPEKCVHTGLPVRQAILAATKEDGLAHFHLDGTRPVFLVTGGSQGAKTLNTALSAAIVELLQAGLQVIWITGPKNYAAIKQEWQKTKNLTKGLDPNGLVLIPYLNEMEKALAAADLVLGRAGASFIAEILVRGLPSVLVPYPFAAGNHQELNAASLVANGAALMIQDKDLTPQALLEAVLPLVGDRERLAKMAAAAKGMAAPKALDAILAQAVALFKNQ